MRKGTWFVLTFVTGVIVGCAVQNAPPVGKAQAQPAGAKWEHKFFSVRAVSVNQAAGPVDEITKKTLQEINDGGWEYSGYAIEDLQKVYSYPLFKRQRK